MPLLLYLHFHQIDIKLYASGGAVMKIEIGREFPAYFKSSYPEWCYVKITDTLNLCFLVKSAKCTNWSHLFHGLLDNEPLMA